MTIRVDIRRNQIIIGINHKGIGMSRLIFAINHNFETSGVIRIVIQKGCGVIL